MREILAEYETISIYVHCHYSKKSAFKHLQLCPLLTISFQNISENNKHPKNVLDKHLRIVIFKVF